jgi:chitinase
VAPKDPYNLPPKRLLVTTFIPSAWADDTLIAERKAGLADYLFDILSTPEYKDTAVVQEFLSGRSTETEQKFDLEDALPSTVTRNKALAFASNALDGKISAQAAMIYGSYYTSWSASVFPPEKLDYSKFDILYFGLYIFLLVIITLIHRTFQHS